MKRCAAILRVLNTKSPEQRSEAEKQQLQGHLQGCPSCRGHQAYMQLTSQVLSSWEIPEVSPLLAERLLKDIQSAPQSFHWTEVWGRSRWFPVAAVAAFAMAVLLLLGSLSLPTSPKLIKQHLALQELQGPSFKVDKVTFAARSLGLGSE